MDGRILTCPHMETTGSPNLPPVNPAACIPLYISDLPCPSTSMSTILYAMLALLSRVMKPWHIPHEGLPYTTTPPFLATSSSVGGVGVGPGPGASVLVPPLVAGTLAASATYWFLSTSYLLWSFLRSSASRLSAAPAGDGRWSCW